MSAMQMEGLTIYKLFLCLCFNYLLGPRKLTQAISEKQP